MQWHGKDEWVCCLCKKKIKQSEVGSYTTVEDKGGISSTFETPGEAKVELNNAENITCRQCAPKMMAIKIYIAARNQNRDMTVEELRKFEAIWSASSIGEVLKSPGVKPPSLPDNGTTYDSFSFNEDRQLVVEFTCPKCSGKTKAITPQQVPEEKLIWDMYMEFRPQVELKCPNCQSKIIIYK